MKRFIITALLATCLSRIEAAPFLNLDFDSANTNTLTVISPPVPFEQPYPIGFGPIEDLLPGWGLTLGDSVFDEIPYNAGFTGRGVPTIVSRDAYEFGLYEFYFRTGFQGDYAMAFSTDPDRPFVLTQRGDVPLDAQFFNLDATFSLNIPVEAQINGTPVANGDDISGFAGQNVELQLKIYRRSTPSEGEGVIALNGVAFVVPEPGTIALSAVGGALLGLWLWKRRR